MGRSSLSLFPLIFPSIDQILTDEPFFRRIGLLSDDVVGVSRVSCGLPLSSQSKEVIEKISASRITRDSFLANSLVGALSQSID